MDTVLWSGQGLHQPKQRPGAEGPEERAKADQVVGRHVQKVRASPKGSVPQVANNAV